MYTYIVLFLLRISMGWIMFYAGITKVINPEWSAAGVLNNATFFPEVFTRLAQPDLLPIVNFLNEWGLTLLGISLILGVFVRLSAFLGALLMILYYFALYNVEGPSYYIEDHIVYALVLLLLSVMAAGRFWGIDKKLSQELPFLA